MALTGLGFAAFDDFWPLFLPRHAQPLGGRLSVFLPLEQALLARSVAAPDRTALFARYSLVGSLLGAAGTLLAALPELVARGGVPPLAAFKGMFVLYAIAPRASSTVGCPRPTPRWALPRPPRSAHRARIVYRLAALFSLDAFAGGLVVHRSSPSGCSKRSACRWRSQPSCSSGWVC